MVAEIGDSICPWCLCSIRSENSQTTCETCKEIIVVSFSEAQDVSHVELIHWLRCLCPPLKSGKVEFIKPLGLFSEMNLDLAPASISKPD